MPYPSDPSSDLARRLLDILDRSLQSIWDGDPDAYAALTAADVSFYEWYISPVRIDGLDFHLREILVHRAAVGGGDDTDVHIEHEVLQPRIQVYGDTAIISYTLFVRAVQGGRVQHLSHNESRVYHNFGDADDAPDWRLVHCHKSPIATKENMGVLRS